MARWQMGEGLPGREPAPGVQASAQLQPAAEPDRAVLEDAQAACDAQQAIRQPGGPQGLDPQQPVLLPDHAEASQNPAQRPQETRGKPDSIIGFVYECQPFRGPHSRQPAPGTGNT